MIRITFFGVPSSGKSTAAYNLHRRLTLEGRHSLLVPEYARSHITIYGVPTNAVDQFLIAKNQSFLEGMMRDTNPDILISEVPPFITAAYVRHYFGAEDIAKMIEGFNKPEDYDVIFWTDPLELRDDGVRFQTPEDQGGLENRMRDLLKPYSEREIVTLEDGITHRIDVMYGVVEKYF